MLNRNDKLSIAACQYTAWLAEKYGIDAQSRKFPSPIFRPAYYEDFSVVHMPRAVDYGNVSVLIPHWNHRPVVIDKSDYSESDIKPVTICGILYRPKWKWSKSYRQHVSEWHRALGKKRDRALVARDYRAWLDARAKKASQSYAIAAE